MFDIRRLGTAAMFLLLLAAGPARAAPEVGWWWNPNESGRGFFVESQNGIIYLAGYFYEADGRATWLVSGGPNSDSYNYQGRLLAYGNGQTLVGDYKPPSPPTDAGPVSISFSDDTHGTIVWPGGTIPIIRQVFGGSGSAFEPSNGWWWNDAESGRGYSVELQGDKLFVVGFMYDGAGKPVWYYSAGPMSTPTRYSGQWLQFSGGQTLLGPYQPPGAPVVVGQLNLEFTAIDEATLEIQDGAAAAAGATQKARKTSPLKRQFKDKEATRPDKLAGGFTVDDSIDVTAAGTLYKSRSTWNSSDVELLEQPPELYPLPDAWVDYVVKSGSVTLEFEQDFPKGGARCVAKKQQFKFTLNEAAIKLRVTGRGRYQGTIEQRNLPFTYELVCTDTATGREVRSMVDSVAGYSVDLGTRSVLSGAVSGSNPGDTRVLGPTTIVHRSTWRFEPAK